MKLVVLACVVNLVHAQSKPDLRKQLTEIKTQLSTEQMLHAQERQAARVVNEGLTKQVQDLIAHASHADVKEVPKIERKMDEHQAINTIRLDRNAALTQQSAEDMKLKLGETKNAINTLNGRVRLVEGKLDDHSNTLRRQELKDDRFWYGLLFMIGLLVLTILTGAYLLRKHG